MINFFREWIFNLAAVSIVLVLINTLAPTGKSKKVIDLVSGFILILTIVQPFFNLFLSNFNLDEIYDQNDRYLNAIITETGKLGENATENFNADELKEKQNKQIINIYSKKLAENIHKLVMEVEKFQKAEVELIINEDYNSRNYGEIKKIYVNAYLPEVTKANDEAKNKIGVNIKRIEEVRIYPINGNNNPGNNDSNNNDNNSNNNNINNYNYNTKADYQNNANNNDRNAYDNGSNTNNNDRENNDRVTLKENLVEKIKDKVSLATGVKKDNIIVTIHGVQW